MYVIYMEMKCAIVDYKGKPGKALIARIRVNDYGNYESAKEFVQDCWKESHVSAAKLRQIRDTLFDMYGPDLEVDYIIAAE